MEILFLYKLHPQICILPEYRLYYSDIQTVFLQNTNPKNNEWPMFVPIIDLIPSQFRYVSNRKAVLQKQIKTPKTAKTIQQHRSLFLVF